MGKRQRWGGKRLRVGGKRARHERCCCGKPLADCPYCPDGDTPNQYDVAFDAVELTQDCQDVPYGGSYRVIGDLDGTYRVTRTDDNWSGSLCWWQVQTDLVIRYYTGKDCTGDYQDLPVLIYLYQQGPPLAAWHINVTSAIVQAVSLFGSGASISYYVYACRSSLPVFANENGGYGSTVGGINGTATVSLPP